MKSLSIILSFLFSFILSQEKILFVGNSFTFYWNLPSLVNEMCNYSGDIVDIYQSTAGGATLKQHWVGDKNLKTMDLLKENKYSLIILQDHSPNPILKTKESLEYFSRFIKIAKKNSSRSIIYGTWTYPSMPIKSSYGKDPIISNLIPLSKEFNVPIAPVGTAFRLFQERYPNISLFTSDNKHPSPVGTYLAACIFYRMITKKNSKGLPRRFTTEDKNGKKIYINIVEKITAEKCQLLADSIILQQY